MSKDESQKGCACTQNLQDLLRAIPPKNDPLRKVTCAGCGKVHWTNSKRDYCLDCYVKKQIGK